MSSALTTGEANVTNSIELLLGKEHPDISYLKKDKIASVISKALSETYRLQPNDPVQFFSQYLLNHNKVLEYAYQNQANESKVRELKDKHKAAQEALSKKEEEHKKELQIKQTHKDEFFNAIENSSDLNKNLQGLVEFLENTTGATGVYIGKLVHQKKEIEEDAADNAHIDEEAPKVIQYTHATKSHQFMLTKVLTPDMGPVTHSCFAEQEPEEAGEEEGEEGEAAAKPKNNDILNTFRHVYVPQVVRDSRMWFKKVPRLGSFMAVPLIYQSCLSDEALEAAISDFQNVTQQRSELQKEIDIFEDEQIQKMEAAQAANEPFEKEEREWPTVEYAPFISTEEKFVICLDTLGQDREFSDNQKRFVLEVIQAFKKNWERAEIESLTADRDRKIERLQRDPTIEQEANLNTLEQIERTVDELVQNDAKEYDDEEQKDLEVGQHRLSTTAKTFANGGWTEYIQDIQNLNVIRIPRIIQSLMFLLKVQRNQICEPESNRLFWKNAKQQFDGRVQELMATYRILGVKSDEFKKYQTINYCEKLLEGLNQEEVDNYSVAFGKIYKWLATAIQLRKQDIIRRKALTKKARENRESRIKQGEERTVNRENYLNEAQDKFKEDNRESIEAYEKYQEEQRIKASQEYGEELDEDDEEAANQEPPTMPEFNREEVQEKFDDEFPEIEIPEPVEDEIDNDWVMEPEEWDAIINNYLQAKGETN